MKGDIFTILITLATLVFLYVYSKDFGYKVFKSDKDTYIRAFVFLMPNILSVVLYIVQLIIGQRTFEGITFTMFFDALMAGITEESIFRILPILFIFSKGISKERIYKATVFSACIFGLLHVINLFEGVNPGFVAFQVGGAFCVGVLYSAVFIRTGSAVSIILMHFVNDFVGFMDTSTVTDGYITAQEFTYLEYIDIGFFILCLAVGFYLIRTEKHAEIKEKWATVLVKPEEKSKVKSETAPEEKNEDEKQG